MDKISEMEDKLDETESKMTSTEEAVSLAEKKFDEIDRWGVVNHHFVTRLWINNSYIPLRDRYILTVH